MSGSFFAKVDDVLWGWAANNVLIEDFTVGNVMNAIGLSESDYQPLIKYLLSKQDFWLNAYVLLLCPDNHKGEHIPFGTAFDEDVEFECYHCGQEYSYDPEHALLAFSFTDAFRAEAIEKKKPMFSAR